MGFHFGLVNMIATAVIIMITILNIIVYKLRQLHEANFGKNSNVSSSQQLPETNLGENLEVLTEDSSIPPLLKSEQLCRHFSLAHILLATSNFDDTLIIGHGGFGKVYKGVIADGTVTVAIKRLSPMSRQGAPQFWTEVELLSKFRHSHLVSLIGYYNDCNEMILVYEYMACGSLADHLYKLRPNGNNSPTSSWVQRIKICIGAAQGLDYLHTGTGIHDRVIHRDFKSSNILLDDSWAAKVSDFGLSKIGPANHSSSHVSTNVKGTFGYVDPEYLVTHRLTRKSDVYSFGVVLLEVLSGRQAVDLKRCEEQWGLAGWAKECIKKRELDQIIDPNLRWQILQDSLTAFVKIADQCLHYRSKKCPTMAEVVASLESALALQERTDSSMFEADFLNLGGTFDNQENLDNSIQESEVNNASDGEHLGEEKDNILSSGEASSLRTCVSPARMTPFKRMARLFFFGKSRAASEISNLESLQYDFGTLRVATDNFSDANKLGNDGFEVVFKGRLQDGRDIAVKRFTSNSMLGESEFRNEASFVGKLQHRNLVGLLGFCRKGTERLLVSEFVPNGSLDYYMRYYLNEALTKKLSFIGCADPIKRATLDWERRYKIIRGVARGLLYLHEDSPVQIIHGDVKTSNVLLDTEMNPKISGFSLAKLRDWEGSVGLTTLVTAAS
ncbi:hypothetical protein LguiB_005103 [Lonicera macranthoides]